MTGGQNYGYHIEHFANIRNGSTPLATGTAPAGGPEMAALKPFHSNCVWSGSVAANGMGPGSPEMAATGKGTFTPILDGAWLVGDFEQDQFLDGKVVITWKAHYVVGWDPRAQEYKVTYVDNNGSATLMHGRIEGERFIVETLPGAAVQLRLTWTLMAPIRFTGATSVPSMAARGFWLRNIFAPMCKEMSYDIHNSSTAFVCRSDRAGWFARWPVCTDAAHDPPLGGNRRRGGQRVARRRIDHPAVDPLDARHHINAPPKAVWPWIAQIGDTRGGYYSYTFIENQVGAITGAEDYNVIYINADRIHPEWQNPQPGEQLIQSVLKVREIVPGQYLLADSLDPSVLNWVWLWHLQPMADGQQTRLLVRFGIETAWPARSCAGLYDGHRWLCDGTEDVAGHQTARRGWF